MLRTEPDGAVSTQRALIADVGAVGMAGFGQEQPVETGLNQQLYYSSELNLIASATETERRRSLSSAAVLTLGGLPGSWNFLFKCRKRHEIKHDISAVN